VDGVNGVDKTDSTVTLDVFFLYVLYFMLTIPPLMLRVSPVEQELFTFPGHLSSFRFLVEFVLLDL